MHESEILDWTIKRISFVNNYLDNIEGIKIFNETEVHFGKKYYRIYFLINTSFPLIFKPWKDMTASEMQLHHLRFFDDSVPNYISFYSEQYNEREVEVNFNWITALFDMLVKTRPFKCEIVEYVNESYKAYLIDRDIEQKETKIKEVEFFKSFDPIASTGDIILIEKNSVQKLLEVKDNKSKMNYPYVGYEIKSDLKKGRRIYDDITENEILIVISQEQVAKALQEYHFIRTKTQLINLIKNSKDKLDLKYIR